MVSTADALLGRGSNDTKHSHRDGDVAKLSSEKRGQGAGEWALSVAGV
jgi:hypothetical protein